MDIQEKVDYLLDLWNEVEDIKKDMRAPDAKERISIVLEKLREFDCDE